jgi:hypothetical protein
MGFAPDWYIWRQAATWLGTDPLTLESHPDGEYWLHRALVALDAEGRAEKQRSQRQRARRG